jgi:hypothetical protein
LDGEIVARRHACILRSDEAALPSRVLRLRHYLAEWA